MAPLWVRFKVSVRVRVRVSVKCGSLHPLGSEHVNNNPDPDPNPDPNPDPDPDPNPDRNPNPNPASKVLELLGLGLVYTGPGVPRESTGTVKAHLLRRGSLTAEGLVRG